MQQRQVVLENANEGIAQLDQNGRILEANPAFERTLGFDQMSLVGSTWKKLVPVADRRLAFHSFRRMLDEGKAKLEIQARRRDGSPVDIELVLVKGESTSEQFRSIYCFLRDITRRKRAERRLKESELQYRILFEKNPHPMWVYNPKTLRFLAVNEAAVKKYGFSREEFLTITLRDVRPPEEMNLFYRVMDRTIREVKPWNVVHPGHMKHRTKDGKHIDVEITLAGIDFNGIEAHLSIVQDVTERYRAQELLEVQRAKMIASSRMSALGEMAGGIAHEINTPLTVIYGRTSQLLALTQAGKWDRALFQKNLDLIESTAARINEIIRGLRVFARDGAHDPILETEVKSIIDDTLILCQEKVKYLAVDLRVHSIDGLLLPCRATQISQVVLNLLNNACDAVENMPTKWIKIDVAELPEFIEISVTDSGPGIAVEHHHKLFQPFFSTKEVGKGTGLGLSVSHGIVNAHGGSLRLDNASPHTRFVIRLPKAQAHNKGKVDAA